MPPAVGASKQVHYGSRGAFMHRRWSCTRLTRASTPWRRSCHGLRTSPTPRQTSSPETTYMGKLGVRRRRVRRKLGPEAAQHDL
eukprot:360870-Chlamydomonas_euryale.AAC.19